jgi:hypothetical protein
VIEIISSVIMYQFLIYNQILRTGYNMLLRISSTLISRSFSLALNDYNYNAIKTMRILKASYFFSALMLSEYFSLIFRTSSSNDLFSSLSLSIYAPRMWIFLA